MAGRRFLQLITIADRSVFGPAIARAPAAVWHAVRDREIEGRAVGACLSARNNCDRTGIEHERLGLQAFRHSVGEFVLDEGLQMGFAIARVGVSAEEFRLLMSGACFGQDLHDADHCPRIVTGESC